MILSALMPLLLAAAAVPVAIGNADIRVEVDPQMMAVRYVGPPDGPNLVEPLHVERRDRRQGSWLDAGGITWDVTRHGGDKHDAALRRGPAVVLTQSERRVVMLSPHSEESPYRLKLVLSVPEDGAEVAMTATLTADTPPPPGSVSLRCAMRLRPGAVAGSFEAKLPVLYALDKGPSPMPLAVDQWDGILMDAGEAQTGPMIAAALGGSAAVRQRGYLLTREVEGEGLEAEHFAAGRNIFAVNDPRTHSYGLVLESPAAEVGLASPLVYREVWRLTAAE